MLWLVGAGAWRVALRGVWHGCTGAWPLWWYICCPTNVWHAAHTGFSGPAAYSRTAVLSLSRAAAVLPQYSTLGSGFFCRPDPPTGEAQAAGMRCSSVAEGLVAGEHSPYLVQRVLTLAVQPHDPLRCSSPHTLRRGPCGPCVRADEGWLARGHASVLARWPPAPLRIHPSAAGC